MRTALHYHQLYNFWTVYDPASGRFGNQKVVFDAIEKIIFVSDGVTVLDIKEDVYSAWKEWILGSQQYPLAASYPEAISAIGGEPLTDTLNVGATFFLENGWRIQPYSSGDPYILTVNGNIYTREAGGNPFLFAEGASINLTRSNLVDQIVAKAALTQTDFQTIANYVWEKNKFGAASNSYGELVNNIDSDLSSINIEKVNKGLTKGEFLALK
jgi:hypothetical protein